MEEKKISEEKDDDDAEDNKEEEGKKKKLEVEEEEERRKVLPPTLIPGPPRSSRQASVDRGSVRSRQSSVDGRPPQPLLEPKHVVGRMDLDQREGKFQAR